MKSTIMHLILQSHPAVYSQLLFEWPCLHYEVHTGFKSSRIDTFEQCTYMQKAVNLSIFKKKSDFFNLLHTHKPILRGKLFILQEAFWGWKYSGYTHTQHVARV